MDDPRRDLRGATTGPTAEKVGPGPDAEKMTPAPATEKTTPGPTAAVVAP